MTLQIAVALVIGQNKDNIGLWRRQTGQCGRKCEEENPPAVQTVRFHNGFLLLIKLSRHTGKTSSCTFSSRHQNMRPGAMLCQGRRNFNIKPYTYSPELIPRMNSATSEKRIHLLMTTSNKPGSSTTSRQTRSVRPLSSLELERVSSEDEVVEDLNEPLASECTAIEHGRVVGAEQPIGGFANDAVHGLHLELLKS